jgi:hypothetical protein
MFFLQLTLVFVLNVMLAYTLFKIRASALDKRSQTQISILIMLAMFGVLLIFVFDQFLYEYFFGPPPPSEVGR